MLPLDVLYKDTVTLFNRVPGRHGEPTLWIPSIIEGVHLTVNKSSTWGIQGGSTSDDVNLHIRYMLKNGDVIISCKTVNGGGYDKKWYEPKAWRRELSPRDGITFSFGEHDDFDFFIEGVFDEFPSPISDENFERKGFYGYMNAMYDNVFAITSVQKFNLIPHFEITAR